MDTTNSTEAAVSSPGRTAPLADLYLRHAPSAVALAYLLCGDRQLAEDLVQEAFVRLAAASSSLASTCLIGS